MTMRRNVDYSDEILMWQQTLSVAPHCLQAREILGDLYSHEGRWTESRQIYQSLLSVAGENEAVWVGLAAGLSGQKRYQEAIEILRQGLQRGVRNGATLEYEIGRCYGELHNDSEAEAAFQRAAQMNPAYTDPLFALGALYGQQKRWDEAVAVLTQLTQIAPNHSHGAHNLAAALLKAAEAAEARADRATALAHYNHFLQIWNGNPNLSQNVRERIDRLQVGPADGALEGK
jgi:tetratricopeptide (TPR) repeat protein